MIGQTLAHYKVIEHLGSGGMGEVYLAVDSKLDRKVALKFLPAQMTAQPDARARFLQEARAASALNHPNVCTIYDIQEHDGQMFIVMEYVEGQTLRNHKNPFTLKQVVEIGVQVADGLAAAHEKGIVHRDIKTENIMIRKDGIVQIMDFGLAKLHGASRLTKEGSTVGTVGYSSPEQIQGQDTDHRTDLFSLGVVLYELISGELPFKGVHETAIMYEIVNVDPQPLSAVKPDFDPELDRIILDCLQKDPDERCQSAKEIARDLRRFKVSSGRSRTSRVSTIRPAYSPSSMATAASPPSSGSTSRSIRGFSTYLPWAITAISIIAVAMMAWFWGRQPEASPRTMRFALEAPEDNSLRVAPSTAIVMSPDGSHIAFVAADSIGETHLWVRSLNAFVAQMLSGTEGASFPFWAPDSRRLAFFADGKLKKIDITGGPPLTLCNAEDGRSGDWNRDDILVFSRTATSGLSSLNASGGEPVPVTELDTTREETTHRWAAFLPDGNKFLYYSRTGNTGASEEDAAYLGSLDGSVNRILMRHNGNVKYARGHIIFVRENTLMAQLFDTGEGIISGSPFPIAEDVSFDVRFNHSAFSVSEEGSLCYVSGPGFIGNSLIWYDRRGVPLDTLGEPMNVWNCRLSPDEKRLAIDPADDQGDERDIWIYDLAREIKTRLTFDSIDSWLPIWSPDGSRLVFSRGQFGRNDIYQVSADGTGEASMVLDLESGLCRPLDWSSDGRTLLFRISYSGLDDVMILPMNANGSAASDPLPFQKTEFDEDAGAFSPDGRWIAYSSDESGRSEVYVRAFPGPGGKRQVSTTGGDRPRWRKDGKELYYLDLGTRMMVAEVDGAGSSFQTGSVRALFDASPHPAASPYDVSADGQRFIVVGVPADASRSSINVVVNWDRELVQK